MRFSFFLIVLLIISSCSNNFKKYKEVGSFLIYELQCDGKHYMTIENCSCDNLPQNYFIPKFDSNDQFYRFYAREENNRLKVYSLYEDFEIKGNIKNRVDFIVSNDNSSFMDFIQQKDLKLFKGYASGNISP